MLIELNKEHIDQLVLLEKECFTLDAWSKEMLEPCFNGGGYYALGYKEESLVGYLLASENPWEMEILSICVKKDYRGKGIAVKLLQNLINYSIKTNKEKIFLEVRKSNFSALNLYKKMGFTAIYERKKYYQNTEDAIVMELSVNES